MRWLQSLAWGTVGALPGLILFALPGFIESQAENLAMTVGGMALAFVGFGVGVIGGWRRGTAKRQDV